MKILVRYTSSVFQDFESYLRTEVDLIGDDLRMIFDGNNSSFPTYQITTVFEPLKIFPRFVQGVYSLVLMDSTNRWIMNSMILA